MSGKAVKSIKDENPELQNQIGCVNGFFQLFELRRFITGRPLSSSHDHRSLTSGKSSNQTRELNSPSQKATEKNMKVMSKEKERFSTETSMTSFSSSCSSSSSYGCTRAVKTEPVSPSQSNFCNDPKHVLSNKQSNTPRQRKAKEVRDVVKESIYTHAQGLSVKTVVEKHSAGHTLKYIDSPRPFQSPRSTKTTGDSVFRESFRLLGKFREAPGSKEKNGHELLNPKDTPRLSYDSLDSRDAPQSSMKLKELPRLSLDSRQGSVRGSADDVKSVTSFKDPRNGNEYCRKSLKQIQEAETPKRPSSVVAKLMGLDDFPPLTATDENLGPPTNCLIDKKCLPLRSSRTDDNKQYQSSGSPKQRKNEPTLPRSGSVDSIVRSSSRVPMEPAPWRHPDSSQVSKQRAPKEKQAQARDSKSSISVYGEIEKRLAQLEFRKCGNDLRALKQILEAMQKSQDYSIHSSKDQASDSASISSNKSSLNECSRLTSPRNLQSKDLTRDTRRLGSAQSYKLPIVIVKPAKLTSKTSHPAPRETSADRLDTSCSHYSPNERSIGKQTNKDSGSIINLKDSSTQLLCSKDKDANLRASKQMQSPKISEPIRAYITTSAKVMETKSPRLQQKFGFERHYRQTSPSQDSSRNKKQSRQPKEASPSSRPCREIYANMHESRDKLGETRNKSLDSPSHIEVINISQSHTTNFNFYQQHRPRQENKAEEMKEQRFIAKPLVASTEQPSPVSVLDATFYRDDPPSPLKKKSNILRDDEAPNLDEPQSTAAISYLSYSTAPSLRNMINDRELHITQNFVHSLQEINWIFEESPCDRKNPEHRYISEILIASGLLGDPGSGCTMHPSGHLINSKLFLTLEKIKATQGILDKSHGTQKISQRDDFEHIERKLIFDFVCEILAQKLVKEFPSVHQLSPTKLTGRKIRGQELLVELCSNIDQLQCISKNGNLDDEEEILRNLLWGELKHSVNWTDCSRQTPEIVLDVERMIFRDLINEIVSTESAHHPGRHCRQLPFSK